MNEKDPSIKIREIPIRINRGLLFIIGTLIIIFTSCFCSSVYSVSKIVSQAVSGVGIEGVDLKLYTPVTVKKGEIFDMELTVVNNTDEPQSIDSIGFGEGYLSGINLIRTQPRFLDRENITILGLQFDTFIFLEVVRPGETIVIKIESEAIISGDYSGQVGVCISEMGACEMLVIRTIVED